MRSRNHGAAALSTATHSAGELRSTGAVAAAVICGPIAFLCLL